MAEIIYKGTKSDPAKLDMFQNIKSVHWNVGAYIVFQFSGSLTNVDVGTIPALPPVDLALIGKGREEVYDVNTGTAVINHAFASAVFAKPSGQINGSAPFSPFGYDSIEDYFADGTFHKPGIDCQGVPPDTFTFPGRTSPMDPADEAVGYAAFVSGGAGGAGNWQVQGGFWPTCAVSGETLDTPTGKRTYSHTIIVKASGLGDVCSVNVSGTGAAILVQSTSIHAKIYSAKHVPKGTVVTPSVFSGVEFDDAIRRFGSPGVDGTFTFTIGRTSGAFTLAADNGFDPGS